MRIKRTTKSTRARLDKGATKFQNQKKTIAASERDFILSGFITPPLPTNRGPPKIRDGKMRIVNVY